MSFNNYPQRITSPCLNCRSRQSACHAHCKRYQTYKDKLDEQNQLITNGKQTPYAKKYRTPYQNRKSVAFNHYGEV